MCVHPRVFGCWCVSEGVELFSTSHRGLFRNLWVYVSIVSVSGVVVYLVFAGIDFEWY